MGILEEFKRLNDTLAVKDGSSVLYRQDLMSCLSVLFCAHNPEYDTQKEIIKKAFDKGLGWQSQATFLFIVDMIQHYKECDEPFYDEDKVKDKELFRYSNQAIMEDETQMARKYLQRYARKYSFEDLQELELQRKEEYFFCIKKSIMAVLPEIQNLPKRGKRELDYLLYCDAIAIQNQMYDTIEKLNRSRGTIN